MLAFGGERTYGSFVFSRGLHGLVRFLNIFEYIHILSTIGILSFLCRLVLPNIVVIKLSCWADNESKPLHVQHETVRTTVFLAMYLSWDVKLRRD